MLNKTLVQIPVVFKERDHGVIGAISLPPSLFLLPPPLISSDNVLLDLAYETSWTGILSDWSIILIPTWVAWQANGQKLHSIANIFTLLLLIDMEREIKIMTNP